MTNAKRLGPYNFQESKAVKAWVFELGDKAAKQMLLALTSILSLKSLITREQFDDVLDDIKKYNEVAK